jgi:hypothetical protein
LLQFEVTQILLHNARHGHSQSGGEVLLRHCSQLIGILQKANQAGCQTSAVARLIEIDRQILTASHLLKVFKVCTYDGNAVGAGQVSDAAAAGRGGIGHDSDRGALKKGG